MLRIAVPNKGSLSEPAADMLREAGYRSRRDTKELVARRRRQRRRVLLPAPARHRRLRRLRHRSTSASPAATCCSTPAAGAVEVMPLGFGASTFRFAARPGIADRVEDVDGPARRHQLRRAGREAPGRARRQRRRSSASTAPSRPRSPSGVADVIADVVETGTTLRNQGLEVFGEPILRSEAVLIRREGSEQPARPSRCCVRRLQGVIDRPQLRDDGLRRAASSWSSGPARITPGLESPTVSPLHDQGWVAVRAMVPALGHQPGHGRALRPRRPGHPRHRHRRLPALMSPAQQPPTTPSKDPYAAFRPRRGRKVALGCGRRCAGDLHGRRDLVAAGRPACWAAGASSTAWRSCSSGSPIAAVMWRFATIRAVPSREGLVVRNLFTTRRLSWAQIVRVQFGGGAPWVTLDLDDTDTVAVMAIQKADGTISRAEAGRLSALVQVHGERPEPRPALIATPRSAPAALAGHGAAPRRCARATRRAGAGGCGRARQ